MKTKKLLAIICAMFMVSCSNEVIEDTSTKAENDIDTVTQEGIKGPWNFEVSDRADFKLTDGTYLGGGSFSYLAARSGKEYFRGIRNNSLICSSDEHNEYYTEMFVLGNGVNVNVTYVRNKVYSLENDQWYSYLLGVIDEANISYYFYGRIAKSHETCGGVDFFGWERKDFEKALMATEMQYRKSRLPFLKLYSVEANSVEVFRNETAKDDNVWDSWVKDPHLKSKCYEWVNVYTFVFDENLNITETRLINTHEVQMKNPIPVLPKL